MTVLVQGVRDGSIVAWRNLLNVKRNADWLFAAVIQPIMFVLLFAYVFGGMLGGASYREVLLAGIFVQTVSFNSAFTVIGLANDLQKGIVDRFRSLPMSRIAVLLGRTVSDLVVSAVALVVMSLCGLLVGWRIRGSFLDAVLAFLILLLFAFAMSWIGALIGLSAPSVEVAQSAGLVWLFPVSFISSAFVPAGSMPGPLRAFAEWNPFTAVIGAVRERFGNVPPQGWPTSTGWPVRPRRVLLDRQLPGDPGDLRPAVGGEVPQGRQQVTGSLPTNTSGAPRLVRRSLSVLGHRIGSCRNRLPPTHSESGQLRVSHVVRSVIHNEAVTFTGVVPPHRSPLYRPAQFHQPCAEVAFLLRGHGQSPTSFRVQQAQHVHPHVTVDVSQPVHQGAVVAPGFVIGHAVVATVWPSQSRAADSGKPPCRTSSATPEDRIWLTSHRAVSGWLDRCEPCSTATPNTPGWLAASSKFVKPSRHTVSDSTPMSVKMPPRCQPSRWHQANSSSWQRWTNLGRSTAVRR